MPRLPGSLILSSASIISGSPADTFWAGCFTTPTIPCEDSVSVSLLNNFSGRGSTIVLFFAIFSSIAVWLCKFTSLRTIIYSSSCSEFRHSSIRWNPSIRYLPYSSRYFFCFNEAKSFISFVVRIVYILFNFIVVGENTNNGENFISFEVNNIMTLRDYFFSYI